MRPPSLRRLCAACLFVLVAVRSLPAAPPEPVPGGFTLVVVPDI